MFPIYPLTLKTILMFLFTFAYFLMFLIYSLTLETILHLAYFSDVSSYIHGLFEVYSTFSIILSCAILSPLSSLSLYWGLYLTQRVYTVASLAQKSSLDYPNLVFLP